MKQPLVSVMVPTFNRAHLLPRTLMTCVGQTYKNLEILVYDDGSTDKTEQTVRRIKDRRVRYERGKKNVGELPSRTRLLALARGEYGCWIDSDDLMNKWRVELQLGTLQTFPDAPFVRCAHVLVCNANEANWKALPLPAWKYRRVTATKLFRMSDARANPYEKFYYNGGDVTHEYTWVLRSGTGLVLPFELYHQDARPKDRLTKVVTATKEKKHAQAKKLRAIMDPLRDQIRAKGWEPEGYPVPNKYMRELLNRLYGISMPLF